MPSNDTGRYRKIFPRLWRSAPFQSLDGAERLIALYVLSGPQTNRIGVMHFSIAAAAEDLGTLPQTFREGFSTVCQTFGWRFDEGTRVLWIPSWWRFNPPENVNVLKGCLHDLAEVPNSPVLSAFCNHVETLPETFHQTFRERMAERLAIQEQEQEQEQEQKQEQNTRTVGARVARRPTALSSKANGTGDREGFNAFWEAYPRKVGKDAARRAWQKRRPDAGLLAAIIAALAWQRQQDAWVRDGGRYVPNPATWLNEGRWEDEPNHSPRVSDRTLAIGRAAEEFVKS